jgi:hypothetical protein
VNKLILIALVLLFATLSFFNSIFFLIPCSMFAVGVLAACWVEDTQWEKVEISLLKARLDVAEGTIKKLSVKTMFA